MNFRDWLRICNVIHWLKIVAESDRLHTRLPYHEKRYRVEQKKVLYYIRIMRVGRSLLVFAWYCCINKIEIICRNHCLLPDGQILLPVYNVAAYQRPRKRRGRCRRQRYHVRLLKFGRGSENGFSGLGSTECKLGLYRPFYAGWNSGLEKKFRFFKVCQCMNRYCLG